jgi:hypothetical protein
MTNPEDAPAELVTARAVTPFIGARVPTEREMADLDHDFKYHPPQPDQVVLYGAINEAAKGFARILLECCPPSADRSAALRKIREARMTANASIALERPAPEPSGFVETGTERRRVPGT